MEMELIDVLRVLWRRWKLIVSIVLVTLVVLGLRLRLSAPVYRARALLQLTVPQIEDVAVFDQYRYSSARDEIVVARNNLTEVLRSDEVRNRVISALSLGVGDAEYALEVESVRDADFIYVSVEAQTPALAADIANTHVDVAVKYYGELRAKPTDAEKNLLAAQLGEAEEELRAAEDALAEFKTQNGVSSLESALATHQKLLEELQLERNQRLLEGPKPSGNPGESGSSSDAIADVDKLIAQREAELARLVTLGPTYKSLEDNVAQARQNYQHLQDKYTEAAIKTEAIRAANFIQVAGQANPPSRPVSYLKWLALALAGSLGSAVLLAFLLEYVSGLERPAPEQAIVVLPDGLLEGLRESQRAANAIVVTPSASFEAPMSVGPSEALELDRPPASE